MKTSLYIFTTDNYQLRYKVRNLFFVNISFLPPCSELASSNWFALVLLLQLLHHLCCSVAMVLLLYGDKSRIGMRYLFTKLPGVVEVEWRRRLFSEDVVARVVVS